LNINYYFIHFGHLSSKTRLAKDQNMKTIAPALALSLVTLFLYTCKSDGKPDREVAEQATNSPTPILPPQDETKKMVDELTQLVLQGNPANYIHWNAKRAEMMKQQLNPNQPYNNLWFSYCTQLMRAGKTEECIAELESYFQFQASRGPVSINQNNYAIYELYALSYLRLGEQQNCQNAHTPFSCILPLKDPAIHQLQEGSRKAIEIYTTLYNLVPEPKYKWLINLAYMTLGEHPEKVPANILIEYPNWKLEEKNFKRFTEISMNVGVAQNGISGGTCVDDFNNDGLIDIFASSYGMNDQAHLFINNGKGSFDDKTSEAGLTGIVSGLNCIHADYNNDGFKDILILRGAWLENAGAHPNSLLKNNGDGTFSDVTRSAGILSYHPSQTATWFDYDKDGHLDLFIGNETRGNLHPCELYHNKGDGTFEEIANKVGLGNITVFVKGTNSGDFNNDGWPDLYVSVMGGENMLFKNEQGKFKNIGRSAGVAYPEFSFATWFWDVNNDGYEDIFVAGYDIKSYNNLPGEFAQEMQGIPSENSTPRLYINNGDETFTDATKASGLYKPIYAMGSNFGDLDNDGYLDFYLGTGAPSLNSVVPNRMFLNKGGKSFDEVTSAGGFGHIQKGHGVAFADIDRDGDQDIYAVMGGAFEGDLFTNVLFENPGFDNNWVTIQLTGNLSGKDAIGSTIELQLSNGEKIFRSVNTGGSFGSNSLQAEIGLGKNKTIDNLIVHWLNSPAQTFDGIENNTVYQISEGDNAIKQVSLPYIPFSTEGKHVHHH
jgi:tetratricopeptide (TPR) repeat protein